MATLAEAGGSGTSPNATKTAKQLAAEASLTTLANAASKGLPKSTVDSLIPAPPVVNNQDIVDAKAMAANVAQATGQKIDKATGEIIIDPTAIEKKFPAPSGSGSNSSNNSGLMTKEQWDALQLQTSEEARLANEKKDAFALIQQTMQGYGFTSEEYSQLSQYIESALINPKIGPNQMILDLRALPVYKARFAGNETRVKNGINALSEADYVNQENSYAQYFKAGGILNLGNRNMYAKLIGGAVAPTEVGKRINLAVDRVQNSDPEIINQLSNYYTNINKSDLVGYFLDPESALPELEKKVATAEIGTAAKEAGMDYGLGRISGLQAYGVDRAQAIAGYGNIGQVLPVSQKLGDIYSESGIKYDQTAGESEFFKSNADAIEKRRQLKSLERAQFQGDSGLSSQFSSLGKSIQGKY